MYEAYQPIIDDGRSRFPEDPRVKAPRGAKAVIAAAAERKHTSHSEYVRQALLRSLEADASSFAVARLRWETMQRDSPSIAD